MKFMVIGSVVLLILAVAKGLLPNVLHFLPLGGSTVAEMGIVFGIAVSAAMLDELRRTNDE